MSAGQHIEVNGLTTYYEVHGDGEPMLLMHGGFCTVETFAQQTPHFAAKYQVIVPERRGHGRTPDVNGPITYESRGIRLASCKRSEYQARTSLPTATAVTPRSSSRLSGRTS